MQGIQWQDRFRIGVDLVDEAHHKLFDIVQKIMELYVERHEGRFACEEGIKYFKAYALRHFAEEEAYMRGIGYSGYLVHKRLHDRMRRETLPTLERELYATNFSTEAVQRFLGVCVGWLTGHIMIEDRAITGKAAGAAPPRLDDSQSVIRALILYPLQEILGLEVQFIGQYTPGELIRDERHYELIYRIPGGPGLRLVLVIGEQTLLDAAGLMFGMEFYDVNEIARFAVREIVHNLVQRAAAYFVHDSDAYQLVGDRFLEAGEFHRDFVEHPPRHSLLFGVKEERFALCIEKLPPES